MGLLVLVLPLVLVGSAFAVVQNAASCGVQKVQPDETARIVGASETSYGEFPWMAALHYKHETTGLDAGVFCGGFVIDKRFVLTAASCLHIKKYKLKDVWLGVRALSDVDTNDVDKVRKFDVEKVIPHEGYNPITNVNDIALLKLKDVVAFSDYISPICLPESSAPLPESGTLLTVAGWGNINQEGPQSDLKLQLEVPMYKHDLCLKKLGYAIRSDQICAEGENLKGTCWGDAGGPLMQSLPDGIDRKWYAIGLISGVNGCGKQGIPIVHTRISSFYEWIEINLNKP